MPRGVWGVLTKLRDEGYASFLVGGAVRDTLAGRPPKDFDILTTAPPSALLKFFRKARLIGARFPVVHVLGSGRDVHEVSTLLPGGAEGGVAELPPPPRGGGPGAPPPPPKTARAARQRAALAALDGGVWPADAAERGAAIAAALAASAAARDFTVNALFFDPWTGEVHDPTGRGLADLAARRLASVDEPGASFASDPARMLRAVRLVSRTGLRLAPADADAIGTHAHLTASLSAGRLGGELTAWLAHGHAAPAVAVARRCGLLPYVLPAHAALLDAECGPMGRGEGALAGEGEGDAQPSRRAPARVGGMAALPALDSCASPSSPAPPAIVAAALLMPLLADEIRRWAPGASADEAGPAPSSGSGSEGDDPGSSHDADRPPETPAESAFRRLVHRAIGRMCVPVACAEAAADPNTRLISRATAASAGRMIRAAAAGELSGSGADARPPRATSSGLARYEPVFRECLPLAAAVRAKVVGRES